MDIELQLHETKVQLEPSSNQSEFWASMYHSYRALKRLSFVEEKAQKGLIFTAPEFDRATLAGSAGRLTNKPDVLYFFQELDNFIRSQVDTILEEVDRPIPDEMMEEIQQKFPDLDVELFQQEVLMNSVEAWEFGMETFLEIRE